MRYGVGVQSLWKMLAAVVTGENGAPVVTTAAGVSVTTCNLGSVSVDDLILFTAYVEHAKGLALGDTDIRVSQSAGTATVEAHHNQVGSFLRVDDQKSGSLIVVEAMGMLRVTVAGTLTLRLFVASAGSDGSIDTGAGELACYHFGAA